MNCTHCHKEQVPIIECITLPIGNITQKEILEPKIIFIKKGSAYISFKKIKEVVISSGNILFLPSSIHLTLSSRDGIEFIIFRMRNTINFCQCISLESLYKNAIHNKKELYMLNTNNNFNHFLDSFWSDHHQKHMCSYYHEIKIQELYYLLKNHYPIENLAQFFAPLLSGNISFSYFVHKNHNKVKTVQELADLYGYSLSGFEKQFHKTFGTSAYKWMLDKKVKGIYHELKCSNYPLKEIAANYGFASLPQFSDFCKKHLGAPPGKVREISV